MVKTSTGGRGRGVQALESVGSRKMVKTSTGGRGRGIRALESVGSRKMVKTSTGGARPGWKPRVRMVEGFWIAAGPWVSRGPLIYIWY